MKLQIKTLVTTIYFFLFGISIGTFMETALSYGEKNNLLTLLNGQIFSQGVKNSDLPRLFLHSAGNNLGLLALMALAGATILGFPAAIAAITYKGIALGFASALILQLYPENGVFLVLLSILPQNLFIVPALMISANQATILAATVLANRSAGIKKSLARNAGPYVIVQLCLSLIVILGCIVESFICPMLLQLIK